MKPKIETVHDILFQQLKYIDDLCRDNEIEYSLYAGTLLGAIREDGFIPWDDDADIAMTRPNFERFLEVSRLHDGDILVERNGLWVHRCKTKTNISVPEIDYNNTCTDIFIFDVAPKNRIQFLTKVVFLLFIQAMIKPLGFSKSQSIFWNCVQLFPSILGRFFCYEMKVRLYDWVSQLGRNDRRSGFLHSSNDQFKHMLHRYNNVSSSAYIECLFKERMLMVFEDWEDILIKLYGPDYLTPPPKSEQIPMHSLK